MPFLRWFLSSVAGFLIVAFFYMRFFEDDALTEIFHSVPLPVVGLAFIAFGIHELGSDESQTDDTEADQDSTNPSFLWVLFGVAVIIRWLIGGPVSL